MGQFEPIHDAHAIEQMALALQVAKPLTDLQLQSARKALDSFASSLPASGDLQFVQIGIGLLGPMGVGGPGNVPGRSRSKIRQDGTPEYEFRIDRNSIAFRTTAYTRWDDVWQQVWAIFGSLVESYLTENCVASIAVTFQDKFYWSGEMSECLPEYLLRDASPYVAPAVYGNPDFWHNHYGAFQRIDNNTKRLVNLNCDCLDEIRDQGPRRIVSITTALTDMLNQAGYNETQFTSVDQGIEYFHSHVHQMHDDCKILFSKVVNDAICKRIGLFG